MKGSRNIKTYLKKTALIFLMPLIFYSVSYAAENSADKELLNAATRGDTETAAKSIAYGASPDARDRLGNTPLILASDAGYQEIVRLLIDKKASVNAINKFGYTPLLSAVTSGQRYIASLLIKAGADAKIPNIYGTTAEDFIKIQGFFTMGEYISEAEGVISTKIDDGKPRRGELGALHNPPWREKFNKLLSENKSSEAAEYLVKTASENNDEAALLLGVLLIERNDAPKGVEWLRKAMKSDDSDVLYNAGIALLDSGIAGEYGAANEALKKAANKGNILASVEYAKNLLNGRGIEVDKKEAYLLFSESAVKNSPEALYYKAYMDYSGLGDNKDEKTALEDIRKASDMGSLGAKTFLNKLDTDVMMKNITAGAVKGRNTAKTYFASINAAPFKSDEKCDVYDLSQTFASSYKITSVKICDEETDAITFFLSPAADEGEIGYLKNISGGAKFIIGETEPK